MTDAASPHDHPSTLRLVLPQWQGAGTATVAELLPGMPIARARRAYAVGARVLDAILPLHDGPTEIVDVADASSDSAGGIESRAAILATLDATAAAIARHDPERILTLGGDCAVSVAPFTALARRYGDDLAVVWIDAHPDTDTPATGYDGFHAMAVTAIAGEGDAEVLQHLPAAVAPDRIALAGLHAWVDDAHANVARWGLSDFSPDALRDTSEPLLAWLRSTGATKVAIHLDVDVVDGDEAALGLGAVPGGLTRAQTRRIVADLAGAADVVGMTIAEFIPRDVLALQQLVDDLPLVGG